jgi:hypothetical protein
MNREFLSTNLGFLIDKTAFAGVESVCQIRI